MTKITASPRYNIISLRINEDERRHLESLAKKTHKSVSDIMREAIESFSANHENEKQTRKAA